MPSLLRRDQSCSASPLFDNTLSADRRFMNELEETNQHQEAAVAMIAATLNEQQEDQHKQTLLKHEKANNLRSDLDATSNRASANPDSNGETSDDHRPDNKLGFGCLKLFHGEATQWKDWRFNITMRLRR